MSKVYLLGNQLQETDMGAEELADIPAIFLCNEKEAAKVLKELCVNTESDGSLRDVYFCKVETQQEYLYGTLAIPKLLDVLGSRYRISFYITKNHIVLINEDEFAARIIRRIRRRKVHQGESKEKFLYNFIVEFINRDTELLDDFEHSLMLLEEDIMKEELEHFHEKIQPIRKQLLILRGYYDQIMDMCKEFEENENRFFSKKQLKYFGILADRADRLMGKTIHLIDYGKQVQDAYQAKVDARQNANMQFLTIISTIFFPLTLITGWYGMNFQNMPELEHGYPAIVGLSILVVIACITLFKKKKLL